MASSLWSSVYTDTIAPWLSERSDPSFLSAYSGLTQDGGALVVFFERPFGFLEGNELDSKDQPQLSSAIVEGFSRHLCQRLNATRADLERIYNPDHLTVHAPDVVSLKGLQVLLESYTRTDSLYDETPPSHILLMPTTSRRGAVKTFDSFLNNLKAKNITGDAPVPHLDSRAHAAFFTAKETALMLDESYWHRVFEVNPLLLKKPAISSTPRQAL
jgi:hypothetical protein